MKFKVNTPLNKDMISKLRAGDMVLLSGIVYTARDAAHDRLIKLLDRGDSLPLDIEDQIIYYVGPTPAKPGKVIGSAGPTSSYRMDSYTPRLLELGLKGMIGKGQRNIEVIESMKKNGAVYFGAIGGIGALIGKSVIKSEVIAYEDLGTEAIRKLEVIDMPLMVVIDSLGNNLYELGPKNYLDTIII